MPRSLPLLILGLTVTIIMGGLSAEASNDENKPQIVSWIKTEAIPLVTAKEDGSFSDMQKIRPIIGNARIVSLGESTHGTREIFQMKHRFLTFLVEEMGFTVFGIEASYPDCEAIREYVVRRRVRPVVLKHLEHSIADNERLGRLLAE